MSSVSYVGALSSAGPNGGTQTFNLTLPSGCAAGDFAVVTGNMDGQISDGDGMSIAGGVTLFPATSFGSDGETSCIIGKFLTSTDVTNGYVTVTKTGPYTSSFTGLVARVVGTTTLLYTGSTWNPDNTPSTNPTATGTSISVPAGSLAIWGCFLDISGSDNGFINTPSGWTLAKLVQESFATHAVCYKTYASAGTTGAVGAATASSDQVAWAVWMVALQPSAASGALSGSANLAFTASATAAGAGALAGAAGLSLAAAGVLKGAGALAGSASLGLTATATLKAAGALVGAAALAFAATGTPAASGALAGSAALTLGAGGTLAASGALHGTAPLVFTATGTATGSRNALSGSAGLAFTAAGTLAGKGALAGSAPLTFTATATPNGSSALAGSANLAFTATGALTGIGILAGAADLAFAVDGTLRATGLLAGNAVLAFTARGIPSASAALGGAADLIFTSAGRLRNKGATLPADGRFYAVLSLRPFYAAMTARSFYTMSNPNITPTFDTKDPRETVVLTFDATPELEDGETLTSVESTDVSMTYGADSAAADVVSGPQITGAPITVNGVTIATGKAVQAIADGGLTNCGYLIAITCNTSNADKVLTLKGKLPVSAA